MMSPSGKDAAESARFLKSEVKEQLAVIQLDNVRRPESAVPVANDPNRVHYLGARCNASLAPRGSTFSNEALPHTGGRRIPQHARRSEAEPH